MIIKLNKRKDDEKMCKPLEKLFGKSAEYVLDNYGKKYMYPIDIVQVARNIGNIDLGSMDFAELDKLLSKKQGVDVSTFGAVRVRRSGVTIIYSEKLDPQKDEEHADLSDKERKEKLRRSQRFTIAHELAHCCLHIDAKEDKDYIEFRSHGVVADNDPREELANIFAGELLMPKYILDEFVRDPAEYDLRGAAGRVSVEKLADAFLVNNHVMVERLRHLRKTEDAYSKMCFDVGNLEYAGDLAR